MHVAICLLTLHRPDGLRDVLRGIAALDLPVDASVEVVVVDNDPDRSAEPVVAAEAPSVPWPVRYEVEPQRGIPYGRNRAVDVARLGGADLVAFIDDDEVPEPPWLVELLRARAATGADVVTGPVLPVFDGEPPAWVVAGGFFDRPRYADLSPIHYARTSNVLIDMELLVEPWPPFDVRFGLNGGDDTHFFLRVRLGGATLVWADRAIVTERVPASRISVRWLVRRAYRRGNTLSLCLRDLQDTWPRRGRRLAASVRHVLGGLARSATALWGGRSAAVRGVAQVAYGCGLATGLVGIRYDEYRTIHGR